MARQKALFGISHDITGRKRLETALRESEEKYQALLKRSDSQAGKGTQFKNSPSPVRGAEDAASNREGPAGLPQDTETILLAEDEPSLRRLIARVLRTQGYTVLEAADGNEALALAQANGAKIQLLITDVIMPGLSSKMLAEWLKQVNPGVRVLFISGYINNNAVRDAMSKPGTFFLQKPFNPLGSVQKGARGDRSVVTGGVRLDVAPTISRHRNVAAGGRFNSNFACASAGNHIKAGAEK